ncbi:MAG: PKD domain-containing protein, partial [Planctomycetes bacterium]|nr:PKD domain-containing protein [Planctomycetota bacterium]
WNWLAIGFAFLSAQALGGQRKDNDPHATGALRPTAKQREWADKHMVAAGRVRLNKLGLDRVNAERKKRGQRELTQVAPAALGSEVGGEPTGEGAPAEAGASYVDNSTLPYFPPIRSQGSLGSCAQFSAVYYTLTHMTAMARGWDAKTGGDGFRFSPKWTYNMVNGGVDGGSWHYDAYAIAQKHGVATWAEFPYDSNYRAWCLNPAVWRTAINVRADQAGRVLNVDTEAGLAQLKQLLLNGYVLNFATYIGSWQFKPASDDPSTTADDAFVGKNCATYVNGSIGGHVMTVVGYSDDIWVDINGNGTVDAGEKGALRIANSWGTGWQEGGFTWFAYDALKSVSAVPGAPAAGRQEGWWYREACWVTARPSYAPTMLAKVTLNHLKRDQLLVFLGIGDTTATQPANAWFPSDDVLYYGGGSFAFDGTTTACDGSFWLDFSDIAPTTAITTKRWFAGMVDNASGDAAAIRSFNLYQVTETGDLLVGTAANTPKAADEALAYVWIDYFGGTGNKPPVAVAVADVEQGFEPLIVDFDGSSSYDSDGFITRYDWDFGDGTVRADAGPTVSHIYTTTGTFTVTLTVTDNQGATASTTLTITVVAPEPPAAPTGLTATVSKQNVTLTWTDNSTTESGFYVERGVKVKKSFVFARIATVGPNATTYTDSGLAAGTYAYRVQAFRLSPDLTSAYCGPVTATVRAR